MASGVYQDTVADTLKNTINLDFTNFKAALFTTSLVVPSFDSSNPAYGSGGFASNEVPNGSGYATGGKALTSATFTAVSGVTAFKVVIPAWTSATFSYRYTLFYDVTTSRAFYLYDWGTTRSVSSGTELQSWPSDILANLA